MYVCMYVRLCVFVRLCVVCVRIFTHERTTLPSGEPHASSIPNVMDSLDFCSRCASICYGCAASNCLSAHKFATPNCCKCIAFAQVKMRLQSLTNQNVHSSANAATPWPVPGRDW